MTKLRLRDLICTGIFLIIVTTAFAAPVQAIPQDLNATPSSTQVRLQWKVEEFSFHGSTIFTIQRATNSDGPYTTIGTTNYYPPMQGQMSGSLMEFDEYAAQFIDNNCINGTTYFYRVCNQTLQPNVW